VHKAREQTNQGPIFLGQDGTEIRIGCKGKLPTYPDGNRLSGQADNISMTIQSKLTMSDEGKSPTVIIPMKFSMVSNAGRVQEQSCIKIPFRQ